MSMAQLCRKFTLIVAAEIVSTTAEGHSALIHAAAEAASMPKGGCFVVKRAEVEAVVPAADGYYAAQQAAPLSVFYRPVQASYSSLAVGSGHQETIFPSALGWAAAVGRAVEQ